MAALDWNSGHPDVSSSVGVIARMFLVTILHHEEIGTARSKSGDIFEGVTFDNLQCAFFRALIHSILSSQLYLKLKIAVIRQNQVVQPLLLRDWPEM